MMKAIVTLGMAMMIPAMAAGAPAQVGQVYKVPALEYLTSPQTPTDSEVSTVTVDLVMYERENGVPAVQALVEVGDYTQGIMLRRDDVPSSAGVIFGSLDTLWAPYSAQIRGANMRYQRVLELLDENGHPPGVRVRMMDMMGEPMSDVQVTYEGQLRDHFNVHGRSASDGQSAEKSTGIARLTDDGELVLPRPSFGNAFHSQGSISPRDVRVIDPVTGTEATLATHGFYRDGSETSVTVPFLNDWSTSVAGLRKFEGRIYKDDGSPAGGVKFQVMLPNISRGDGMFGSVYSTHNEFRTGPDGLFRFAWNFGELASHHRYSGVPTTLIVNDQGIAVHQELDTDKFYEIRTRKTQVVKIELVDENEQPVDLLTTPTVVGDWVWFGGRVGRIRELGDSNHHGDAILQVDQYGALKPVQVKAPGEYTVQAWHYVAGPRKINVGEETVQMRVLDKIADVKLRIVDLEGRPVEGTYVGIPKLLTGLNFTTRSLEMLKDVYDRQQAGEDIVNLTVGRTDENGVANLRVRNLTNGFDVWMSAEGYGFETTYRFADKDADRYVVTEGIVDLGEFKLAREARARLRIRVPNDTSTSEILKTRARHFPEYYAGLLQASFLGNEGVDRQLTDLNWWLAPDGRGESGEDLRPGAVVDREYSVPAETTFTLRVVMAFDTTATRKLEVMEPLAPGEVRDFGVLEVHEPVEEALRR